MATAQDQTRTSSPPRHEAFLEEQLGRARRRIRTFDLAAGVLGFLAGTLLFGLAMIGFDLAFDLSGTARLLALAGYGLAATAYVAFFIVWPLVRSVNPYYAALRVEGTVPGAKNSIINWLDLRSRKLAPAIRNAVSNRAAHDVAQADLDQAISGKRVAWLGSFTAAVVLAAVIVLCVLRPAQFLSLFGRVFAPFGDSGRVTRTQIELLEPRGNATVPVNQPVNFRVRVGGKIPQAGKPDALRLKFRYSQEEPTYQERALESLSSEREWGLRLPGFEVKNGFWYRIAGGDAETEEFHVIARALPAVERFEVTYKYRPYLHRKDRADTSPSLQDLRGTEVTLTARTNRYVKEGQLRFEGEGEHPKPIAATVSAERPDALVFRFVLENEGLYRVRFTTTQGEDSGDSIQYPIRVLPDLAPQVVLTKPGEDVTLPATAVLGLEGEAKDDFGLTDLTLRLKLKDGDLLQPRVYRGDEKKGDASPFRFPDGTFPRRLAYKDILDLAKLKDAQGRDLKLRPGMVIEYWLEATDNCDYPKANVARTERTYLITIAQPPDDAKLREEDRKKQEEERKKLEEEQKQHQARQNQELQKEQKEREKEGQNPDPKDQRSELEKEADRIKKELEKDQNRGQKKPDGKEDKGQQKEPGNQDNPGNQPGEKKNEPKNQPKDGAGNGDKKPEGPNDPNKPNDKGDRKPEGQAPDANSGSAEKKPMGQGSPDTKQAGEKKEAGDPNENQKAGKEKGQGTGKPGEKPGEGKPQGDPKNANDQANAKTPAQAPPPGTAKPDPSDAKADAGAKPEGPKGQPSGEAAPGTAKKEGKPGDKAPPGDKKGTPGTQTAKADGDAKPEGTNSAGAEPPPGTKLAPQQNASKDDVAKSARDLQGTGDKKKDAVKDLQDMARNAKDPQVREAAKDELKKAGEDVGPGSTAGTETGKKPDGELSGVTGKPAPKGEEANGHGKGNADGQPEAQGDPKPPDPNAGTSRMNPGDPKGEGDGKQGAATAKEPGKNGQKGNDPSTSPTSGNTGGGSESGGRPNANEAGSGGSDIAAMQNDLRDKLKAGDLLLRRFEEAVKDKDKLKKLDLTPEEAERFIKEWRQQQKDWAEDIKELEKLKNADPAKYTSGPRVLTRPTGTARDPIQSVGPLLPPAEFEKSYREFSQELSRLKPKKEKN